MRGGVSTAAVAVGVTSALSGRRRRSLGRQVGPRSLVVRPHSQHADNALFSEDLVDQPVLNVDPPGVRPDKIANKLLKGWWILERVVCQDGEQFLRL